MGSLLSQGSGFLQAGSININLLRACSIWHLQGLHKVCYKARHRDDKLQLGLLADLHDVTTGPGSDPTNISNGRDADHELQLRPEHQQVRIQHDNAGSQEATRSDTAQAARQGTGQQQMDHDKMLPQDHPHGHAASTPSGSNQQEQQNPAQTHDVSSAGGHSAPAMQSQSFQAAAASSRKARRRDQKKSAPDSQPGDPGLHAHQASSKVEADRLMHDQHQQRGRPAGMLLHVAASAWLDAHHVCLHLVDQGEGICC